MPHSILHRVRIIGLCLLATVGLNGAASHAYACSPIEPTVHELDPIEQELDDEAPGEIPFIWTSIRRGNKDRDTGCAANSCSDIGEGRIVLHIESPTDNRSSSEHIGYRVRLIEGDAPGVGLIPDYDIREDDIVLFWIDGTARFQDAFYITLGVSPVDLGGNVGPEYEVRVTDEPYPNCTLNRSLPPPWMLGAIVLIGLQTVFRRRSANFRKN